MARGRGLRGDRAGTGGVCIGVLGCPWPDDDSSYMGVERRKFGLGLTKSPMRLERGFLSGIKGRPMLSKGSAEAAISIQCRFKSTFWPAACFCDNRTLDNEYLKYHPRGMIPLIKLAQIERTRQPAYYWLLYTPTLKRTCSAFLLPFSTFTMRFPFPIYLVLVYVASLNHRLPD
jgi:hypothetical protein